MTPAPQDTLLTAEEFLKLPDDDGSERELIRGELREAPMTKRNRWHCLVQVNLSFLLKTRDEAPCRGDVPWRVQSVAACSDPHFRTIVVHRAGALPQLYNCGQQLTAGPEMPGFVVRVAEVFEE